jgi:glucokinase
MSGADGTWAIGVDVGGTKVVAGLVDAHGAVVAQRRDEHARPGDYAAVLDRITAFIDELVDEADARGQAVCEGVGVAIAAFLTADRTRIREAVNLGWPETSSADDLRARLGRAVVIENDADAAAWGEYRFGAGAGAACMVMVTLGTGVGGGLVTAGRLHRGGTGLAMEIGHLQVEPAGRPCPCGAHGCLEQYASGTALGRAGREGAARDPDGAAVLARLAVQEGSAITGALVARAAAAGDPVALAACEEVGRWLGLGLAQVAAVVDPSVVVVGGGAGTAHPVLLEAAREAFGANVGVPRVRPEVAFRVARLGNAAGLVGAADRARAQEGEARERETDRGQANRLEPI